MPSIQGNKYYNSPELGAAFQSLASIFAPPSGSDLAGYVAAGAKKAEAQRLADLFSYSTSPDFNQTNFDRMGQAAGAWTPSNGYYGVDVGAATSRSNNAADNARALQTNAADNERALKANTADNERAIEQTRLTNTKDVTTSLLTPVTQGATRFVPPTIADLYGLPATQSGNIAAAPGETIVTPDGRTVAGTPKPLTETEWTAQQNERLRQSGALTDDMLVNTILGDKAPVQAIGTNGKPQYMSAGAAVRAGAEPYNPSADKSLVEGTTLINGKSVQVFRKPNEANYFTADGQPVPADVQVYDKAKPTGTNEQLGMKPTEFTQKNAIFYNRAASAAANLDKLRIEKGYAPSARDFELMLGKAGDVLPLSVTNNLVSPEGRQFYNSAMNFMLSVLRPDTGAAFGRDEFQNYARVFIDLPGDDPETTTSKQTARDTALAALQGSSAGAADQITRIMQANGVAVPPEMLAHMNAAQQAAQQGSAPQQPAASATTTNDPIAAARVAIERGASRDAVIKRLVDNGIDPKGL